MTRSTLNKLSILFLLVAAFLASPVLAVSVHSSAAAAMAEAEDHDGHAHGGEILDLHDAIDHVHNVPSLASPATLAEVPGFLDASLGLSQLYSDDLEQLEAGMGLYDAFYRWCRDATGETNNWPGKGARA